MITWNSENSDNNNSGSQYVPLTVVCELQTYNLHSYIFKPHNNHQVNQYSPYFIDEVPEILTDQITCPGSSSKHKQKWNLDWGLSQTHSRAVAIGKSSTTSLGRNAMVLGPTQLYQRLPHPSPGPLNTSFLGIPQKGNRKSSNPAIVHGHEHTARLIFWCTRLGLWTPAQTVGPQHADAQPGGPGRLSQAHNMAWSQRGLLGLEHFSG